MVMVLWSYTCFLTRDTCSLWITNFIHLQQQGKLTLYIASSWAIYTLRVNDTLLALISIGTDTGYSTVLLWVGVVYTAKGVTKSIAVTNSIEESMNYAETRWTPILDQITPNNNSPSPYWESSHYHCHVCMCSIVKLPLLAVSLYNAACPSCLTLSSRQSRLASLLGQITTALEELARGYRLLILTPSRLG